VQGACGGASTARGARRARVAYGLIGVAQTEAWDSGVLTEGVSGRIRGAGDRRRGLGGEVDAESGEESLWASGSEKKGPRRLLALRRS